MAASGSSGGGLPPRPTVAATRRRTFVAPHRQAASISPDATLPHRQEGTSPGGGGSMPPPDSGGNDLSRRLPNDPPPLGPRALSFTEPHAATWDASRITTSPAEVYEVAGDDFSPNHWTPGYSEDNIWNQRENSVVMLSNAQSWLSLPIGSERELRASSAPGYFSNLLTQESDDATPSTGEKGASKRGSSGVRFLIFFK